MSQSPLIRYTSAPTDYDCAYWGSICTVFLNDDGSQKEFYVQSSLDADKPIWIKASDMFLKVYEKKLQDPKFIEECLAEYCKVYSDASPE